MEDKELLASAKAGNLDAYKELVIACEGKVAGVIRTLIGPTPEAEDIGQEVFLNAFDAIKTLPDIKAFQVFIMRKSLQMALAKMKRRHRPAGNIAMQAVETIRNADQPMDRWEIFNFVFNHLEPELQVVITLRLMEGYPVQAISEMMELPITGVLDRLATAQQQIRTALVLTLK
jgi:RNA polymerase sigma-70 factor, ECF subfamily